MRDINISLVMYIIHLCAQEVCGCSGEKWLDCGKKQRLVVVVVGKWLVAIVVEKGRTMVVVVVKN